MIRRTLIAHHTNKSIFKKTTGFACRFFILIKLKHFKNITKILTDYNLPVRCEKRKIDQKTILKLIKHKYFSKKSQTTVK